MKISIIIPAYNEEHRITKTLNAIINYLETKDWDSEIVIVDDCSKDKTIEVVVGFCNNIAGIRILCQKTNMGKGAAVQRGAISANGEYVLFTDADNSTPIEELDSLYDEMQKGADIVIGSRGLRDSNLQVRQPFYREFMGKTFNKLVSLILFSGIKDTQCGFKLFRADIAREVFARQKIKGFAFDVEILYIAKKMGCKIVEIPVNWKHEEQSRVHIIFDSVKMFLSLITIKIMHG